MFAWRIEQKIFRDVAPQTIRHVAAVHQREATGFVKDVDQQMAKDCQVVPPPMLHSPVLQVLAAVWGIVWESMVAGAVSRTDREAVAAAVSKINKVPALRGRSHDDATRRQGTHDGQPIAIGEWLLIVDVFEPLRHEASNGV